MPTLEIKLKMTRQALVVGLGIGSMYAQQMRGLGYQVTTVDSVRPADFISAQEAVKNNCYDIATISTPNFTHYDIANIIAPHCGIVLVDKPGVENVNQWQFLRNTYPNTRIAMVKNNQWRPDVSMWRTLLPHARTVHINWINHDRVPNPGSWFTNRKLAWGGVHRDLMPHLLSIFAAIVPQYHQASVLKQQLHQEWQLSDLLRSDYGVVNKDGVYDVDDVAHLELILMGRKYSLTADWRSLSRDDIGLTFECDDGSVRSFALGLCPSQVYSDMFADCVAQRANDAFWQTQYDMDVWILSVLQSMNHSNVI
jgi:predicted dehydrogenase